MIATNFNLLIITPLFKGFINIQNTIFNIPETMQTVDVPEKYQTGEK